MHTFVKHIIFFLLMFISLDCFAQPTGDDPNDPAYGVMVAQHLSFGSFSSGPNGGNVIITNSGTRSATGDVVLLNLGATFFHSIFEIEAPPGTIITVINGPTATLTGSNGGTMSLQLGNPQPGSPFSTTAIPPARTPISIGGTLTVGTPAVTVPGTYNGSFFVTFHYQ